jgi:hypothetical protein
MKLEYYEFHGQELKATKNFIGACDLDDFPKCVQECGYSKWGVYGSEVGVSTVVIHGGDDTSYDFIFLIAAMHKMWVVGLRGLDSLLHFMTLMHPLLDFGNKELEGRLEKESTIESVKEHFLKNMHIGVVHCGKCKESGKDPSNN